LRAPRRARPGYPACGAPPAGDGARARTLWRGARARGAGPPRRDRGAAEPLRDSRRRPRGGGAALVIVVVLLIMIVAGSAGAHPLSPGLLEIHELADRAADVVWKTPLLQPSGATLAPELPPGCRPVQRPSMDREGTGIVQRWRVQCDEPWVGQSIGMQGL